LFAFILAFYLSSADTYHEKDYVAVWCAREGGVTEVVLADKTRVDCLLPEYAVEFDYAKKWAESIGQALHYGSMTGRKPAVVLIIKDIKKETRYIKRLEEVAAKQGIIVWAVRDYEIFPELISCPIE
jgi:hypothetical protein